MRKLFLGASLVLALVSACGSQAPAGEPAPTSTAAPTTAKEYNADDIAFAQGMIPHHEQALEMARQVPSRSTNPKLLDLAKRIEQGQDPEIKQLKGMLAQWGAPAEGGGSGHGGHGSGPGNATGAEFDRMWMDMMIEHHEGAIAMARTELAKGVNAEAKALAQKIIDAQQAEIAEMRG